MKVVVMPTKTYHDVRSPAKRVLGPDIDIVALIDRTFVDLRENVELVIEQGIDNLSEDNEYYFLVSMHPYLSSLMVLYATKKFGKIKVLVWDTMKKRYIVKEVM